MQLHVGQTHRCQQGDRRRNQQHQQAAQTQTRRARQLVLQCLQILAQRLAVGHDGGLRFTSGHQALQVAQNAAGLGARLLVHLEQRGEAFARLLVLGGCQAQFLAAIQQALGDLFEGVQVLSKQENRLGAHAFHGQELVGRLADALGQHHQLASRGDFGGGCVLLQFERRDSLGDFQQVRRLAADRAQGSTDLRQRLLLGEHRSRVFLSAIDQRDNLAHFGAVGVTQRGDLVVAVLQSVHVGGQRRRTLFQFRERLRTADQRLRH